jgi:hypothetical protein
MECTVADLNHAESLKITSKEAKIPPLPADGSSRGDELSRGPPRSNRKQRFKSLPKEVIRRLSSAPRLPEEQQVVSS